MNKKVYTIKEAAAIIRCHPETIRRAARRGCLRVQKFTPKFWLIEEEEIMKFKERRKSNKFG